MTTQLNKEYERYVYNVYRMPEEERYGGCAPLADIRIRFFNNKRKEYVNEEQGKKERRKKDTFYELHYQQTHLPIHHIQKYMPSIVPIIVAFMNSPNPIHFEADDFQVHTYTIENLGVCVICYKSDNTKYERRLKANFELMETLL